MAYDGALAVEPAEQDGDGPGVVAEAVTGARQQAQLGAPVVLGELASVDDRDVGVVLAVQDEQRPRGQAPGRGQGAEAAELPGPRLERRPGRPDGGWRRARAACSRKRRGCAAQSSKSARAPSIATPRTRASSAPTHTANEPPVLVPTSQTPSGAASLSR